jgi:hypothetical protein
VEVTKVAADLPHNKVTPLTNLSMALLLHNPTRPTVARPTTQLLLLSKATELLSLNTPLNKTTAHRRTPQRLTHNKVLPLIQHLTLLSHLTTNNTTQTVKAATLHSTKAKAHPVPNSPVQDKMVKKA